MIWYLIAAYLAAAVLARIAHALFDHERSARAAGGDVDAFLTKARASATQQIERTRHAASV